MAEKLCFLSKEKTFKEKLITYTYYPGFSVSQKQKSIQSLHEAIQKEYPDSKILEISTKSTCELGVRLSAFNLMYFHRALNKYISVENVFQAAKTFERGGPYQDLLDVSAVQAKTDSRLRLSGELIEFYHDDMSWPLEPKTLFYDWIYIKALKQNEKLAKELMQYNVFTDIEFNHLKSVNCQARAAAIFVSLVKQCVLEEKTSSIDNFKSLYVESSGEKFEQLTLEL